jgi:ATP-binding cassette subfamily B protein/subfamily B ATP-binding cassette protein MsbA
MALRYKFTFAASIFSAIIVGVLWAANIGTLYPVVEMVFQGNSMQKWVDDKITQCHTVIDEKTVETEKLQTELAKATDEKEQHALQGRIDDIAYRLTAENWALGWYEFSKPYIDDYLPTDPFQILTLITVVLLVGTVVKSAFLVFNSVLVARLAQLATFDLRRLFYRRTLRMDLAVFNEEGTADLMSRFTNDMNQVGAGLESLFGRLIVEPLKMFACLALAGFICWRLLILSLILAPLAAYLVRSLAHSLKRANRRAMEEMSGMYSALEESFRSIKIVKAFTNERQERLHFRNINKRNYQKAMRIAVFGSLTHPLTEVLGIFAISVTLMAGTWMILYNKTTLFGIHMTDRPLDRGMLLLFYGLLAGVADPLRKMSDIFSRLQAASAACDRIFTRLDRQPQVREPKNPVPFHRHKTDLVFENITFGYQPEKQILNNINLTIKFGETIALVGSNGCGKSTLINLIPRFADPTSGAVKLDGIALPDMRLRDVRRQIGLVTQETMLFDDTIFNNIRYGSPQATREQVIEAAKQAHAHRFIEQDLPNGYETSAGALGNCLSGGQRQRIALARAILRDPPILLLDEATSQVDLESEQAIQQVLETFTKGRTTILITHRLGILALADRIVVMQAGEILDVGRHEELLNRCAFYRRLYQIDFDDMRQTA